MPCSESSRSRWRKPIRPGAIIWPKISTRFENGEIADRFSLLFPRPAQLDLGMGADPCPFDTLKFAGPDTRFYWASSINWKQYYKNIKEQSMQSQTQPTT